VTINAYLQEKQLQITVLDQGSGLADKIKNNLFQPHITTKTEGSGMGLYIAQRLVKLFYQGNISLNNQKHNGCVAKVTFSEQGAGNE